MIIVGLTGGIGAGKTTVSDCFEQLGVPVIDTDVIAHDLVAPGSSALEEIVSEFGPKFLNGDGKLDRKRLGELVFSDPSRKSRLESILHPKIKQSTIEQIQALRAPYCIVVVPLLIETDFLGLVDRVLVVDAPDQKRVEWVANRSGISKSTIMDIIASQTTRARRLAAADYVITNDSGIDELRNQVRSLHRAILSSLNLDSCL